MKTPHTLKEIRNLIAQFQRDQLASRTAAHDKGLHISGIFTDKKDGKYRVVILAHTASEKEAIDAAVHKYFGGCEVKVKYEDERPSATISTGSAVLDATKGFGTLGGIFTRTGFGNTLYGLSNNHVIAGCNARRLGDPVEDTQNNQLGKLAAFIPLVPPPAYNLIDAAIFQFDPGIPLQWNPFPPNSICNERTGLRVQALGAKTGTLTDGQIVGFSPHLEVELCGNFFWFNQAFAIKGLGGFFSDYGDSGALVFTPNGSLVGLLFSILKEYSYACPIRFLKPFDLRLF